MTTRRAIRKTRMRLTRSGRSSSRSVMSVEALHASFEKLDEKLRSLVKRSSTDSELSRTVARLWREQFHTELSGPAIKGMLSHYRATYGARKTRKAQRGGMAPLDHMMGQGMAGAVYGRFPLEMGTTPQVVRALDMERFFESPISRSCDATGGAPPPMQSGGGFFTALNMGHAPFSVPENGLQKGVAALAGVTSTEGNPSPVSATVNEYRPTYNAIDTSSISNISSMQPLYHPY